MSFNIMNNIDYRVGIYIRLSKEDEEKVGYYAEMIVLKMIEQRQKLK